MIWRWGWRRPWAVQLHVCQHDLNVVLGVVVFELVWRRLGDNGHITWSRP